MPSKLLLPECVLKKFKSYFVQKETSALFVKGNLKVKRTSCFFKKTKGKAMKKNKLSEPVIVALCLAGFIFLKIGCSDNEVVGTQEADSTGSSGDDMESSDVDADTDPDTDTDTDSDADSESSDDSDSFDECVAIGEEAHGGYGPADIIFVIDNSKSLEDEIAEVRANMNKFAKQISDSGIDVRIIMISCLQGDCHTPGGGGSNSYGICIDPPLGAAGGCVEISGGDEEDGQDAKVTDDNNPPKYTHIETRVPSVKGLEWLLNNYQNFKDVLRPNAKKHIVIVSDDTDETTADEFNKALLALDPPTFEGYIFHAIYSYYSKDAGCAMNPVHACCDYAAPESDDTPWIETYKELVEMTGGASGDLCLQDFDAVFEATATSVVSNAVLSCNFTIPDPPADMTLDPKLVNVIFSDGQGGTTQIGKVDSQDICVKVENGWYYDNPLNPTEVIFCPQTCSAIQGHPGSKIDVEFGCETEMATIIRNN
jgi:hypothetical protein